MTEASSAINDRGAPRSESAKEHHSRWRVLWTVVAAQFVFVIDAFIVNIAILEIRTDLHASPSEIEGIIAVYLIAYAALVILGGRLGDIYGVKTVFVAGLIGFTLASVWCGLSRSGTELMVARLAQGAAAALMVPQVLATMHILFPGAERARAFAIYGLALGCGGAVGFLLGGLIVTLNLAGLGWRMVFFINAPAGIAIAGIAMRLMPRVRLHSSATLDLAGAAVIFAGLVCLIGPLLIGHTVNWAPWLWMVMLAGTGVIAGFFRLERHIEQKGGFPLVSSALTTDRAFLQGLAAAFCFFSGNLSFYLVLTLFLQGTLGYSPWHASLTVFPLALAFIMATRLGTSKSATHTTRKLVAGCALQIMGLCALALLAIFTQQPGILHFAPLLTLFGYGQGLVMAPLSSVVLSTVTRADAGSAAGIYATVVQASNATGVVAIGALFFGIQQVLSDHAAFIASLGGVGAAVTASALLLVRLEYRLRSRTSHRAS